MNIDATALTISVASRRDRYAIQDKRASIHLEHAHGIIATDSQVGCAGPVDRQIFGHNQFARKRNRAVVGQIKGDDITWHSVCNGLPQRARPTVVGSRDDQGCCCQRVECASSLRRQRQHR